VSPTESHLVRVPPTKSYFCSKVTHRKNLKFQSDPQKDAFVLMLSTEKWFVSKLHTEGCNCSSLPTTEDFFEKIPNEKRKRLGATHK